MKSSKRSSKSPEFRFFARGADKVLVLVPGWAADGRVFALLDMDYDYLVPVGCPPREFCRALSRELRRRKIEKVSLFGWSLGGFLAADFAVSRPALVEKIFLAGVRRRYPENDLGDMRRALLKNRTGCLTAFYRSCFSPADDGGEWFRRHLLAIYLREMSAENLLEGLDYLEDAEIVPEKLGNFEVVFIHGDEDRIAPVGEAEEMSGRIENSGFMKLAGRGHIPFLNSSFPREMR